MGAIFSKRSRQSLALSSSTPSTTMAAAVATNATEALAKVNAIISANKVAVFSKSYCPYCVKVKDLFKELSAVILPVELDRMGEEGALLQSALKTKTGQPTVPNVFIGGQHIGGCDDTFRLHKSGKLVPLLQK